MVYKEINLSAVYDQAPFLFTAEEALEFDVPWRRKPIDC